MPDDTDRLANTDSVVDELDEAECLRLISPGGVGRIAYSGRFGPTVLPVNYQLYDWTIVFRTAHDSPMGEDLRTDIAHAEYKVAFEIDDIDMAAREGWSVLVQGSAHHVDSDDEARVHARSRRRALARGKAGALHPGHPHPYHRPEDPPGRVTGATHWLAPQAPPPGGTAGRGLISVRANYRVTALAMALDSSTCLSIACTGLGRGCGRQGRPPVAGPDGLTVDQRVLLADQEALRVKNQVGSHAAAGGVRSRDSRGR